MMEKYKSTVSYYRYSTEIMIHKVIIICGQKVLK